MKQLYCCLLIWFYCDFRISRTAAQDIRLPPIITKVPPKNIIFRDYARVEMECLASGIPKPEVTWKVNDAELDLNRPGFSQIENGFLIEPTTAFHEGFYQCIAKNQYGTAVSNMSHLQRAQLSESDKHKSTLYAVEGQPFKFDVILPRCFPAPTFSWEVGKEVDDMPRAVVLGQRLQISQNGELHFAYVDRVDSSQPGYFYKLNVFNSYRDIRAATNYIHLNVSRGPVSPFAPIKGFTSQTPAVAVEGRNLTLRCFFYGNPAPTIHWSKRGGSMPLGRNELHQGDTEVLIRNVQQSDEGDYICKGSNSVGTSELIIQVNVQAAPVFRDSTAQPYKVNKTIGENVTFHCVTVAEPDARIVWLRNGVPLNVANLPGNFRITNDRQSLTVSSLCKNCQPGFESSGLQVIQCNASNVHGYALGTGYINVLDRTVVTNTTMPINVAVNTTDAARFEFPCSGHSDDSTPVTISWFHLNDGNLEHVMTIPEKRILSDNGSLIIQLEANETDGGWAKYGGLYQCRVDNGYSIAVRNVTVTVRDLPPETEELKTGSLADIWWIFIIIVFIFLILILLLFCCIYMQRNKGDSYPVDLKERKNGNDPEKEILAFGFQDYQRPADQMMTGSRTLLGSRTKLDSDDDGGSMNEYGEVDASKFNEDGSFVGLYNTADGKLHGRSGSMSNM